MKVDNNKNTKIVVLLLMILTLFGSLVITSADAINPNPNMFFGNVTINGELAPNDTVIEAFIDGELHSGYNDDENNEDYNVTDGRYFIHVNGNESDNGKLITFKVNGIIADHDSVTWTASDTPLPSQKLDLSAEGLPMNGDIDGDGDIDMDDVVHLARHYFFLEYGMFPDYEIIYADGDIDCNGNIDMDDVVYLARHYFYLEYGMFSDYENLYPCI